MKTNHTNNTPKGMPPAQPDPGSYSWKLLLIKDARVHYVVLKQQPQTTHPTHTTPTKRAETCMIDAARKPETNKPETNTPQPVSPDASLPALLPQDPTVCQTLPGKTGPQRSRTTPPEEDHDSY